MSTHELVDEYLKKAQEAEARAQNSADPSLKESWQGIALGYRAMAQHQVDRKSSSAKSEQPSPLAASKASSQN